MFTSKKSSILKYGLVAVLIFSAVFYYLRLFDQKLLLGDEGVALTNAWRISYGEIPYRDFFIISSPFSFFSTAIILKIFGPSIVVGRIISLILAFGIIFILNLVLNKITGDIYLKIMSFSLLVPFGVSYWPIPSHHWWADLLCLLSIYFFFAADTKEQSQAEQNSTNFANWMSIFLSGLFCALAVWTLQDQGGYLFIMLFVFFVYNLYKKNERERKDFYFNYLFLFLSGFIFATIPFSLWLLPTAGISRLFQDLVLFPLKSYHKLEGHTFALFSGWDQVYQIFSQGLFLKAPIYSLTMAIITLFFFLMPVVSIFSLVYGKSKKFCRGEKIFLVFSLFVSGILTSLHRWSFTNMVWALPLLLPSLIFLFEGKIKKVARIISLVLTISAILFSISFYRLSSLDRMVSVCGKGGCVKTFRSNYSFSVKEAVSYLDKNSKENETLFCAGFNSLINFLTLLKNPTPFSDFVDYNTSSQYENLIKSIEEKKVDWVLIPKNKSKTNLKIEDFVAKRYEKRFENNFCRIYKIK